MSSEEEAVAAWSAGKRWSPFRHRDELPVARGRMLQRPGESHREFMNRVHASTMRYMNGSIRNIKIAVVAIVIGGVLQILAVVWPVR